LLCLTVKWKPLEPAKPVKNLADWKQFWGGGELATYVMGGFLKPEERPNSFDDSTARQDSKLTTSGNQGETGQADLLSLLEQEIWIDGLPVSHGSKK
jgi:hypothetical protein